MGELKNNNVMGTASGKVGLVVFRQVRGKLIASNKPPRGRTAATEKQLEVVARFKRATRYAKAALADPKLLADYAARVNNNLFSPRLVAMSDYLNAPVIRKIDLSDFKGAVGDVINIAAEDDFAVKRVRVSILVGGQVIETGDAVEDTLKLVWVYKATVAAGPGPITVQATAFDTPGNETMVEKTI